jgi:hypothetical protein
VRAARTAAARRRLPLACHRVADDGDLADLAGPTDLAGPRGLADRAAPTGPGASTGSESSTGSGDPSASAAPAPSGTWEALYGTGTGGACLVRPDGHNAWRTDQAPPTVADVLLGEVLDRVPSRDGRE